MPPTSQDQYVFGPHPANADDGPPGVRTEAAGGRRTTSTHAWTVTGIREVAPDDELSTLCRRVADALPPAVRTAVVLVAPPRPPDRRHDPTTAMIAASGPSTTPVVRIEWLLEEGPVRTSLQSGATTLSSRLGDDDRWPRFARAVSTHDAVSAAAVPIPLATAVGGGVLAAYSEDEAAFDERDVRVLAAFARVVADGVARGRLDPHEDPDSARLVNQAIGVLITHRCDEGQAMRRLRRISESTQQPLAEAARMIVSEAQTEAHLNLVVPKSPQRLQTL